MPNLPLNFRTQVLSTSDKEEEKILRPQSFTAFHGQRDIIENLKVFVSAAKIRGESLDHILLHGPPGLGKTTISHLIASELGSKMKVTTGPIIDKPGDLAGILTSLEKNDVLFIDEIHRLNPIIEEYLYAAMEDFKIDIIIDSGPSAQTIQLRINPFTLVGATTRIGLLTAPLRSRFGINSRLTYYHPDTLTKIIRRSAPILNIKISENAAKKLAKCSRGTPRIANMLLKRARDFAQVNSEEIINEEIVHTTLKALHIDDQGLDEMDHKILHNIITNFKGGPVGIKTIANAVGEQQETIEDVYEPYLMQKGFLIRTPRGREATEKAYKHLNITPPSTLF